jgi:hypothetical protein
MRTLWKRGRGKLGALQPLLGEWVAQAESPMGSVCCTRRFTSILQGSYVELNAHWDFGEDPARPSKGKKTSAKSAKQRTYEERALIGVDDKGRLCFWSFTSDGKQTEGVLADVTDLDVEAFGFETQTPTGRARMAYWPNDDGGFMWVVESRTTESWKRFVEHRYVRA